jgi:hypothetical protein
LDYIPNKRLFAAVMFALKMIRAGTAPGVGNTRAVNYYEFPVSEVAHYTGQAGGPRASQNEKVLKRRERLGRMPSSLQDRAGSHDSI